MQNNTENVWIVYNKPELTPFFLFGFEQFISEIVLPKFPIQKYVPLNTFLKLIFHKRSIRDTKYHADIRRTTCLYCTMYIYIPL